MIGNQLSIFDKPANTSNDGSMSFSFGGESIRIVKNDDGEPLFVAIDVAQAMGISNTSKALLSLDDDQKVTITTSNVQGRQREMLAVTESGLYQLIFAGRKEAAKQFSKWVTSEVLPQIRKTGVYVPSPEVPKVQPPRTSAEKGTYAVAIVRDHATPVEALERVEVRRDGVSAFKTVTGALSDLVVIGRSISFGKAINTEYSGLFGGSAKELLKVLKVRNIRDGLTTLQLDYLKTAERTIEEALRRQGPMDAETALRIIDNIARVLGELLASVSDPIITKGVQS